MPSFNCSECMKQSIIANNMDLKALLNFLAIDFISLHGFWRAMQTSIHSRLWSFWSNKGHGLEMVSLENERDGLLGEVMTYWTDTLLRTGTWYDPIPSLCSKR